VELNPADGSFPWCAAFVYFCFQQAAKTLDVPNPAIKDAGVLDLWNKAGSQGIRRIAAVEASTTRLWCSQDAFSSSPQAVGTVTPVWWSKSLVFG